MKTAPALAGISLVLALLGFPGGGLAATQAPEVAGVALAIQRQPALAILAEDNPGFREEWERRLRAELQLDAAVAHDPDASLQAGMALAIEAAKPYLMRADDAAANRFLSSLGKVIAEGGRDPETCLSYVEAGSKDPDSRGRRARVEARLGPLMREDLLRSIAVVVASGRNGEKRVLEREELPGAIQPVIQAMARRHGAGSLQGLGRVAGRPSPPAERCAAMARMLAAIEEQPEQRRAMLARTLFSGALPRVE